MDGIPLGSAYKQPEFLATARQPPLRSCGPSWLAGMRAAAKAPSRLPFALLMCSCIGSAASQAIQLHKRRVCPCDKKKLEVGHSSKMAKYWQTNDIFLCI